MAAMSDADHTERGLELLLPDPAFIAQLSKRRRPDPDEADDDEYEPPRAA